MKKLTFLWRTALVAVVLIYAGFSYGQQVIGTFSNMDGGFEGQTSPISSTASSTTSWWLQLTGGNTVTIQSGAGARSGNKYLNDVQNNAATRRLHSPVSTSNFPPGSYTVQYYFKGDLDGTPAGSSMTSAIYFGGTVTGSTTSAPTTTPTTSWTKFVTTLTLTGVDNTIYGVSRPTNIVTVNLDDFVVYAGTEDNTAPYPATDPVLTPASNQIGVSWTAPVGGIDGGGYLVVRHTVDPTTAPNVNGIYAVGNTIGSGTVVYIGTDAFFTDVSLITTTQYYYRIYTVDKAFNYSTALTANSTTTAAGYATEPTAQVTDLSFSSVSSSGMTINFTPAVSGGGTNHLVVVGTSLSGDPVDGSSYTANIDYTNNGSSTVAGGKVVYNGSGNSVTVSGLTYNTTYYVRVYDFNGSAGTENYYTTNPTSGSQLTTRRTLTSVASGAWATAATWDANTIPTQNDNVVVGVGHTVTIGKNTGGTCYNLTINGSFYSTAILGEIGYVSVYGTSIVVDGTFADATNDFTGFQFNQNCTLSGAGAIRINRIRPLATAANAVFTFDTDALLSNATGVTLMGELTGSNTIGYKVNAGKTLTSQGSITGGNGSATNASYPFTLTIDGTLNANSAIYLNASSGQSATLTVNGTLNVKSLYGSNMATGGGAIPTITNNGTINVTGTGATADFSNPATAANITGSGTFSLASGATISVGAADGLNPTTGPIRCTTRTFDTGASYQFTGTSAQASGADLPATVNGLTINNAAGVTLGTNTTINGTLALTAGTLDFGANTLLLKGQVTGTGTATGTGGVVTFDGLTTQTNSAIISTGTVNVNSSSQLTNTGTISASTLAIKSTPSGTGTYLNNGTTTVSGTTSVEQYLTHTRNWYISSPVTGAVAPSGYTYYQRDEAAASWTSQPFAAGNSFSQGKGYIALPNASGSTITFSGTLNTGNVTIPLTWSGASSKGFNLIGNPYPSHLIWTQAFAESTTAPDGGTAPATLIDPSIYIRTNGGTANNSGQWSFQTYNATTGLVVPNHSLLSGGIIPPMQAFWVRAKEAGNLVLDATLTKSHQTGNQLKTPALKNTERQIIRLEISNGTRTDETLMFFDANAIDGYDKFDSPKFAEANTEVQLYTTVGTEKLVMNGMKEIPLNQEIPLGFIPGTATSFNIKANEISNLPSDFRVILKDNANNGLETDLTDGTASYQFSPVTNNANRFSLLFRAPGATTGIETTKSKAHVFVNENNQITIIAPENSNYAIYNAVGQTITAGIINHLPLTINHSKGVYVVKVNNQTTRVILK